MSITIYEGDALATLRTLPTTSVQMCVTSPPYYALRDYGVDGQIGLEKSPAEFIAALLAVFAEVRRVLRPDGVCFVNLGDSYAGSGKGPSGGNGIGDQEQRQGFTGVSERSTLRGGKGIPRTDKIAQAVLGGGVGVQGVPAKNLLLIPERFAIAMQDSGLIVRSRIAWCKTSAMPESVRDRPTSAWEHIWMFSKSARYYWDAEAVRHPLLAPAAQVPSGFGGHKRNGAATYSGNPYDATTLTGANLRNFWLLGPEPSRLEHYAGFPTEIPRRCILAGTSERGQCPACGAGWVRVTSKESVTGRTARNGFGNGELAAGTRFGGVNMATIGWQPSCSCDAGAPVPCTVLDPFLGSGTTALVADRLGRHAIGIELNHEYAEMARRRLDTDAGFLSDTTVVPPVPPASTDIQPDIFEVAG